MSLQEEVERQLELTITKTHEMLSTNFSSISQTRQLDEHQNSLLLELDPNSNKYRQLVGALAIDSYVHSIISLVADCEPLLELTAIIFDNLSQAKQEAEPLQSGELNEHIDQAWLHLSKLAQITHQLFPSSPLINVHQGFMDGYGNVQSQAIYGRLYEQNRELKSKLQQNDRQVLQLQLKLTELLQQHDGCDGNIDYSERMLELREQIASKEEEIKSMNEQFSFEIQKYNTVYEVMKREIEELRSYSDVDLLKMIEQLETEIVKLREEKERDEIIINELKERVAVLYSNNPQVRKNSYSRVCF